MARPIAPRFEITVLKDKTGSDNTQVIAGDATIKFYRQGATVSEAVLLPPLAEDYPVNVYDLGQLASGDTVRIGTGATSLYISGIGPGNQVLLVSSSGSSISLPVGTRLVPTNDPPSVYSDPLTAVQIGDSIAVDSVTGRASAYLSRDRVDYDVSIPGQQTRLYVDGAGVMGRSDQRWTDLRDFGANLQLAVDALPEDGGIVFVPTGVWPVTSGVVIDKSNVTIMGEQGGSVLRASTPNAYDLVTVRRANFQMRDLVLDGAATSHDPAGKSCLVFLGTCFSGNSVRGASLWNVQVVGGARYGVWLRGAEQFYASDVYSIFNWGTGVRIDGNSRRVCWVGGVIGQNRQRGLEAASTQALTLLKGTFEGNRYPAGENDGAGVDAESCDGFTLRSCYFEDADNGTQNPTSQFVALRSCPSAVVDACWFQGGPVVAKQPQRAVKFMASPWSRISHAAAEGISQYVAAFDDQSRDCLEFCNRDFAAIQGAFARFSVPAQRFFSMTNRALSAPWHADDSTLPSGANVLPGAIAWVDSPAPGQSKLRIWNGSTWKSAALS